MDNPVYKVGGHEYGSCGTCQQREWCAIYMITVRPKAQELLTEFHDLDKAIEKAKEIRDETNEYDDGGVYHLLRHIKEKTKVKHISFNVGVEYFRGQLLDENTIHSIQGLILEQEARIEQRRDGGR